MSNLVDHARRELELIGEEEVVINDLVRMVEIFASMGHSGASADAARGLLCRLLAFEPLTELTDDPHEWYQHGPEMWDGESPVWQNIRNSQAFSHDGGKTHWLLDERDAAGSLETTPKHRSTPMAEAAIDRRVRDLEIRVVHKPPDYEHHNHVVLKATLIDDSGVPHHVVRTVHQDMIAGRGQDFVNELLTEIREEVGQTLARRVAERENAT